MQWWPTEGQNQSKVQYCQLIGIPRPISSYCFYNDICPSPTSAANTAPIWESYPLLKHPRSQRQIYIDPRLRLKSKFALPVMESSCT